MHQTVLIATRIKPSRWWHAGVLLLLAVCDAAFAQSSAQFEWLEAMPKMLANVPRNQRAKAVTVADISVYNALNAISPRFKSYGAPLDAPPGASPDAAIAAAMMTALSNMPGIDGALVEKTYVEQVRKVADADARNKGIALGKRAALAMIALRAEDDFGRLEQTRRELAPGVYELTPGHKMASSIAIVRHRPYGIARLAAYDPGPPLPPEGAAARRDIAEVRMLGGRHSTQRTGDQTIAALFWNSGEEGDSLPVLKSIAEKQKMSPLEIARMLALGDIGEYDNRLVYTHFKDKYLYWRPYNAIRGKFADAGSRDDKWEALIDTPPNPDYPSGSGVAGGVLARFYEAFNADGAVPLVWKNNAIGVTRAWPSGEALGRELGYSRIWAGVHFRQSVEVGHALGRRMMDEVLSTVMTPLAGK